MNSNIPCTEQTPRPLTAEEAARKERLNEAIEEIAVVSTEMKALAEKAERGEDLSDEELARMEDYNEFRAEMKGALRAHWSMLGELCKILGFPEGNTAMCQVMDEVRRLKAQTLAA
jgi:hypothetical protein